jgi:replicative DNA helicase
VSNELAIGGVSAPEVERAVIGAVLMDRTAIVEVAGLLRPEHFHVGANRAVYQAAYDLHNEGHVVDSLTVLDRMRRTDTLHVVGTAYELSRYTTTMASSAHVTHHAHIVLQYWVQREVVRISEESVKDGQNLDMDPFEVADLAERRIQSLIENVARKTGQSIGEVAKEHLDGLDNPPIKRHSTGLRDLDKALGGGWTRGDLVIIAARPAMGKTSAAFSMISNSCNDGHPTALFSLELGKVKTNARFVSIGTGIPIPVLLSGKFSTAQIKTIHEHYPKYSAMPLQVNFSTGITIPEIRSEAARMVKRHGITALYIDQLNWITPPKNAKDRVAEITRGLKHIANEFDIPVIVLHQLSRGVTGRPDKRPELTDLRDSGAAEQDAQVVIFVHRPEYYNITEDEHGTTVGRGDLIIAKNSNGPTETVRVRFDAYCARFRDNDSEPVAETDEPLPF